jgi:hypothetical protein
MIRCLPPARRRSIHRPSSVERRPWTQEAHGSSPPEGTPRHAADLDPDTFPHCRWWRRQLTFSSSQLHLKPASTSRWKTAQSGRAFVCLCSKWRTRRPRKRDKSSERIIGASWPSVSIVIARTDAGLIPCLARSVGTESQRTTTGTMHRLPQSLSGAGILRSTCSRESEAIWLDQCGSCAIAPTAAMSRHPPGTSQRVDAWIQRVECDIRRIKRAHSRMLHAHPCLRAQ